MCVYVFYSGGGDICVFGGADKCVFGGADMCVFGGADICVCVCILMTPQHKNCIRYLVSDSGILGKVK